MLDRRSVTSPDGTELSVLVALPPDGTPRADLPPVLAVHGFASSAAGNWQRTGHLDALTRAGRVVIAPDLRGHGRSERPHRTEAYLLTTMLQDLTTSVTQVAGDPASRVDLLGYSLGARLCWTLACERALSIRRIVLGGFDGRPLFAGVDTERLDRLAAGSAGNDRIALRHLVAGLSGSGGTPPGQPLPEQPTLLVAGTADPLASRAAEFAGELPHGSFLAVPGRNHISAVPASVFRRGAVLFLSGAATG